MRTKGMKRNIVYALSSICIASILSVCNPMYSYGKTTEEKISADYYEFEKNSKYEISATKGNTTSDVKLGELTVTGDMKNIADVNGVKSYSVNDGNVCIQYKISDVLTKTEANQWHLEKDKSKTIDDVKLNDDILCGALIVQTSLTGDNWITDTIYTNIAGEDTEFNGQVYTSRDIQQVNGCYYRVIVAYYTRKQVEDKKILFVNVDNFDEVKRAETYEFYLINGEDNNATATKENATPRKELGSKINTGKDNGFSGQEAISNKDPHYGWNIGTFFVNGYTRETAGQNGSPIFLKNVGDRVTLWFGLSQDINCLNGNEDLTINEDENGSDQYFEIPKTNFKHGALIIRYTDFEGKPHDPIVYTDYLAASARTGANTKVELFEEGDYEVALDYEIKNTDGIDSVTNYRIFFTFSIRNGNCMVYPFDNVSGAELADNSITENGFKLDMAKSRYLTIDVKKTVVKSGTDGYTEDVRFNRPAKDGESYNDEGIYTFTVKNLYTGSEPTTKVIYVGNTPIMRALASGLSLEDINRQIADGAELLADGTLFIPEPEPEPEELVEETTNEDELQEEVVENTTDNTDLTEEVKKEKEEVDSIDSSMDKIAENEVIEVEETEIEGSGNSKIAAGAVAVVLLFGGYFALRKKKKTIVKAEEDNEE